MNTWYVTISHGKGRECSRLVFVKALEPRDAVVKAVDLAFKHEFKPMEILDREENGLDVLWPKGEAEPDDEAQKNIADAIHDNDYRGWYVSDYGPVNAGTWSELPF